MGMGANGIHVEKAYDPLVLLLNELQSLTRILGLKLKMPSTTLLGLSLMRTKLLPEVEMDQSNCMILESATTQFNNGKNILVRSTLSLGTWFQRIRFCQALGMALSKLYVFSYKRS
jgi:hypothetical protein